MFEINIQAAKDSLAFYFSKIPLLGGLVHCTLRDHLAAVAEFLTTLFFSFLPLLIAYLVEWSNNHEASFTASINKNLYNGELLLYVSSLLSPIFYLVLKNRGDADRFPSKMSHLLLYFSLILLASYVFGQRRSGFIFDPISISMISKYVFYISLPLFYLVLVYNNNLLPNPAREMRDEEEEYTNQVRKHRG